MPARELERGIHDLGGGARAKERNGHEAVLG